MKPVRLLLDENVPKAVHMALRRFASTTAVLRVGQPGAPALHTPDPALLLWCERHERLLITLDRSTMIAHFTRHLQAAHHSWGLLLLQSDAALNRTIDDLLAVLGASEAEDWFDFLGFVPFTSSQPFSSSPRP